MSSIDTLTPARSWLPPSFDAPPPPPPPPPTLSQADIDATLEQARRDGLVTGYEQGFEQGLADGRAQGLTQGLADGRLQAFDEASERLSALTDALEAVLSEISALPDAMAEPVVDLALLVAQRLSGSQAFERTAFMAAVQEALMHLPMPGEKLLLRIGSDDAQNWQEALQRFDLPFGHTVIVDADLPVGRILVEVGGTRLDIGPAARQALVRSALGLPLVP
jgi:hypothetical protein